MKKHILLSTLLSITFYCNSQTIGSWAAKKSLGNDLSARENAGMVSINNKLYILAGNVNYGPKDFTEYNPSTGELNKLQEFPAGNYLNNRILFEVNGKIYTFSAVGFGVSVYDFNTNDWTLVSSIPFSPDSGFVINDIIYLISQSDNDFYAYNPLTNTFSQKANYPGIPNRRQSVAFEINDKGYFGSGRNNGTDCGEENCFTNNFFEYNPLTDIWTTKANLPYATVNAVGIGHNGKGYIGLGEVFGGLNQPSKKSSA